MSTTAALAETASTKRAVTRLRTFIFCYGGDERVGRMQTKYVYEMVSNPSGVTEMLQSDDAGKGLIDGLFQ